MQPRDYSLGLIALQTLILSVFSKAFLAKMPGCIPEYYATILQPNLSPPVRLRQKSEGKARLFLSGDDKNEHLFGFRDQKVAGSNPVTSTTKSVRFE